MGMMPGGAAVVAQPTALSEALEVLRIMSDPKAAEQNLERLIEVQNQLDAKAKEVSEREKAVADREDEVEVREKQVHSARVRHEARGVELTEHQEALKNERDQFNVQRIAADRAAQKRSEELDARATELTDWETGLDAREDELAAAAAVLDARGAALDAQEAKIKADSEAFRQRAAAAADAMLRLQVA